MNSMSYLENSGKSCSRAQLLPDKHGRTVADYRGQGDWSHIDATYLKVRESWRIVCGDHGGGRQQSCTSCATCSPLE